MPIYLSVDYKEQEQETTMSQYMLVRSANGILSSDNWHATFDTLEAARAEMRQQVIMMLLDATKVEIDFEDDIYGHIIEPKQAIVYVDQPDPDDYSFGDDHDHAFFGAESGPEWQIFKVDEEPCLSITYDFKVTDKLPDDLTFNVYPGEKSYVYMYDQTPVYVYAIKPSKESNGRPRWCAERAGVTAIGSWPQNAVKALWKTLLGKDAKPTVPSLTSRGRKPAMRTDMDFQHLHAIIFDKEAVVTASRVNHAQLEALGLHVYELRHGDEPALPLTLENFVFVNFYGCVVTHEPIPMPMQGRLQFPWSAPNGVPECEEFVSLDETISLAEFASAANH